MNSENVSFGKPKATGAIFVAPAGTAVPTDATTALAAAYKNLGYVSEDGLVNGVETDTESVTAWGGDMVLEDQTSFSENFTFNLIETNIDTLKFYYGEDKVTEAAGVITIKQNSKTLPECVLVVELVLTGGRVKRIVVERGKIADRSSEISYVDGEAISYPINLRALPDSDGNTHSEYIAVVA
jgi:hypothetical protein